jgi:hypothetical protein
MAPSLNKLFFWFLLFCSCCSIAQTTEADNVFRPQDYKDQDQFRNFYNRRHAVAKWQINQLKNGALAVRLHTNQKLIEGLRKMGKADLAAQKEYETMAINKNIILAFTKYYKFSKVYFFFSQDSDSLLNGKRKGIFVDSNLVIDPAIEMTESFYLLAEKDDVYNSSIGFISEAEAKQAKETGNASKEAAMVIKNKFGHQLKDPFPFYVISKKTGEGTKYVYIPVGTSRIPVLVEKKQRIERHNAYVGNLNKALLLYYNANKDHQVTEPDIKPFLY